MNTSDWMEKYREGLSKGGRFESIKRALELFEERKGQVIVETGSVRLPEDWGGGMSTVVFGDYCKTFNHHLFTVDIDPTVMKICQELTKEYEVFITYVISDSLKFLKEFNQKIDFLYLDSLDVPEYDDIYSPNLLASQVHQWKEIELVWDKLQPNAVILLDDAKFSNGGKVKFSRYFLKEHGCTEVMLDKQSLWIR